VSNANDSPDNSPEYVSPKRCLAHSFRLSRDRWKLKATERRQQIKVLKVKLRDLEVSRDLWKQKALHLQAQLAELLGVVPPPDSVPPADQPVPPGPTAAPPAAHEADPPKKARRARC
jgi:hypothetical protein